MVMSSSGEGDRPTFFVVMPARNTESMIGTVLGSLSDDVWKRIGELVVLDNASKDGTVAAARRFLDEHPERASQMRVLPNGVDLGYGGSVQRGLQLALDSDCTHALIMHSDDQGDWDAIVRKLMNAAQAEPAPDVVLACRFLRGADLSSYSLARKAGNLFFNGYTRVVTGLRMPDPGTAIIAVRRDVLAKLPLDQLDTGFHFHPELNILFYEDRDLRKTETTLDWRDASEDNHFELFRYGIKLLRMLTKYGWERRVKRAEPEVALRTLASR
jgi:glycosyltransferase involved in cell wall biosynthesis